MITFTTARTYSIEHHGDGRPGLVRTHFTTDDAIQHNNRWYLVLKSGGRFHIRDAYHFPATDDEPEYIQIAAQRAPGIVYRPLHSSVTVHDVEGATHAIDTGTHWVFSHCSKSEHREFAERVVSFAQTLFNREILKHMGDAAFAGSARSRLEKETRARSTIQLAADVTADIRKTVLAEIVGRYHQQPEHDWYRRLTELSLTRVYKHWNRQSESAALVSQVKTTYRNVLTAVTHNSTAIEYRYERVARLAAEKKEKEPSD